jgi:hypothetical protein
MKKGPTSLLTLAATLLLALPAAAQQATNSFTVTNTASGLGSFVNIALGKFNSNLGSLDSVTVTLNYALLGGSFKITSTEEGLDQTVNSAAGRITVRQATTNSLGFTQIGPSTNAVAATPALPYTVPALSEQVFSITPITALTNISQTIDSSFWAAYTSVGGTGDVVFQVRNLPLIEVDGGVYTQDASAFTAETSMTVTYAYTIPEPTTWAMFALGAAVAGLAAARRRGRQ